MPWMTMKTLRRFIAIDEILMTATVTARGRKCRGSRRWFTNTFHVWWVPFHEFLFHGSYYIWWVPISWFLLHWWVPFHEFLFSLFLFMVPITLMSSISWVPIFIVPFHGSYYMLFHSMFAFLCAVRRGQVSILPQPGGSACMIQQMSR